MYNIEKDFFCYFYIGSVFMFVLEPLIAFWMCSDYFNKYRSQLTLWKKYGIFIMTCTFTYLSFLTRYVKAMVKKKYVDFIAC